MKLLISIGVCVGSNPTLSANQKGLVFQALFDWRRGMCGRTNRVRQKSRTAFSAYTLPAKCVMAAPRLTKADRGELEPDYGAAGTKRMRVISEGTPKRFGGPQ